MRENFLNNLMCLADLSTRHIIIELTPEENKRIDDYLQLDDYSVEELRVIRNMFVVMFAKETRRLVDSGDSKVEVLIISSWVTVVTSKIDNMIYSKGGQV